jgi:N-acetylglutamate synthase-like GNAT family acetyltransferase
MTATNFRVRRATVDDLPKLTSLWQSLHFSAADLQNRLTEFQVAESSDGKLLGAIGMQITEKQGLIHSESFIDFSLAEELRPLLWERLQSVATNHGLFRVWTQEGAPFWSRCGLKLAKEETLQKLPTPWKQFDGTWLSQQLRDDAAIEALSAEKEFALFMEAEKQNTEKLMSQAKTLKTIVLIFASLVIIVILGATIWVLLNRRKVGGP